MTHPAQGLIDAIKSDPRIDPAFRDALPATHARITALDGAYHQFMVALRDHRPQNLRAENSPAALAGRVQDVEAQIIACRDWLKALLEDTAQHCYPARRLEDVVETYMGDLASEVRGELVLAMEDRGVRL